MKWTVPVPPLFVRFAQPPGKAITCLRKITWGLRTRSPAGGEVANPNRTRGGTAGSTFVKNFGAGATMS